MGQLLDQTPDASLDEALATLGLAPPRPVVERLLEYATELVHWSRRVDLTGAATVADLVRGPLFDALTLVPALDPGGALVDVGSGGGMPGIPAAILSPGLRLTLVEPRSRRAAFLRHAAHALRLEAEVVQSREEELREGAWDGAVAQAVWPAGEWLCRAPRLVAPGGAVYCLTVQPVEIELLPPGSSIDLERRFVRPWDGARRYATRVRCPH
jgi:16S rRNA (guanine527-N7)-methyltransferase